MDFLRLEDVLSDENIMEALNMLERKRDSCGIDGILLSELRDHWDINGERVKREIFEEQYKPCVVRNSEIVNYKGKKRTISVYSSVDRLILRCISQAVQDRYDDFFDRNCFGYRPGLGLQDAVRQALDFLESGNIWFVKIDIQKYFDRISLKLLKSQLRELLGNTPLLRLINRFLNARVEEDGEIREKRLGIVQGSSLSPFLGNLYLTEFDKSLSRRGIHFCRFGDDISAFFGSYEEASAFLSSAAGELERDFELRINSEKSGVFEGLNVTYLGYTFDKDPETGSITAIPKKKKEKMIYPVWNRESIRKTNRSYHLINDGILSRRDFNLLFENESGRQHIPVETTKAINVYSNVFFSANFFTFASMHNLEVNIFDRYGNRVGSFTPETSGWKSKTMLRQSAVYLDEQKRLELARKIEIGALHNMRTNLRYYSRRRKSSAILKDLAAQISESITAVNEAGSVNDLMRIEAAARVSYYAGFNEIISSEEFRFTKRTRRPPQDPLNALISFGNTWLYNRIATEIQKTSLDIRIGIVHAANRRSRSLNLDIAELFKPVIVDRVIFTLINKHIITEKRYFREHESGGIYLNSNAKRIFLAELEDKIYSLQTSKNDTRSYDTRIRREITKIYRYAMYGEEYKPFKYS